MMGIYRLGVRRGVLQHVVVQEQGHSRTRHFQTPYHMHELEPKRKSKAKESEKKDSAVSLGSSIGAQNLEALLVLPQLHLGRLPHL